MDRDAVENDGVRRYAIRPSSAFSAPNRS